MLAGEAVANGAGAASVPKAPGHSDKAVTLRMCCRRKIISQAVQIVRAAIKKAGQGLLPCPAYCFSPAPVSPLQGFSARSQIYQKSCN